MAQRLTQLFGRTLTSSNTGINTVGNLYSNEGTFGNTSTAAPTGNIKLQVIGDAYVSGKIGIVSTTPAVSLDIDSTDSIRVPVGTTAERPGISTTGYVRFNSDLNTFEGYNGTEWGGLGGASEKDTVVATTSATTCESFSTSSYRSGSITAQITQGSNYQVGKYLVIHNGTTASIIEESAIATGGSMLGSFTTTISGGNLLFQVNMSSASSATVTTLLTKISV